MFVPFIFLFPIQELQDSLHASPISDSPSKPVRPLFSYLPREFPRRIMLGFPAFWEFILNFGPFCGRGGFPSDFPFGSFFLSLAMGKVYHFLPAPLRGLEPRTYELTARCSAIELERTAATC